MAKYSNSGIQMQTSSVRLRGTHVNNIFTWLILERFKFHHPQKGVRASTYIHSFHTFIISFKSFNEPFQQISTSSS